MSRGTALRTVYLPEFVDTEAPVILEMLPAGITYERKPEISAKVGDNVEVYRTAIELRTTDNGQRITDLIGGFDTTTGLFRYLPVDELAYGKYTVKITAWNTTGNEGAKSFGFEAVFDRFI